HRVVGGLLVIGGLCISVNEFPQVSKLAMHSLYL
ncbi:MAG: hypothetical protein ACI927_001612, partial [Oceanospirillaceae bacterium]